MTVHQSIGAVMLALLAGLAAPARAQAPYDAALEAWRVGDYRTARETMLDVRRSPYGRRPPVDYVLGTSGCRLPEWRQWGGNVLDWMLYAYALTHDSRLTVASERDKCRLPAGSSQGAAGFASITAIVEERAAGMTGFGKTFYWANQDQQPVASFPIRRMRDIDRAEFLARLVPLGQPKAALAIAAALAPGSSASVEGRVMIVSRSGHTPADLRNIGQTLDRYLGFLETVYGVTLPDSYITVYLVENFTEVQETADSLHGLGVSPATVGYAFVDDLSVVGAVTGTAVGTVLHELFHLVVRAGFGDIPQWLDEGMAALYEVSGRTGDRYFGLDNWRNQVLDELWYLRPTVDELIRSEWFLFDDPLQAQAVEEGTDYIESYQDAEAGQRQAAMMAMARYFLLYLEQRGELVPVYAAVRDQGFAKADGNARDHVVALVEATLGRGTATLDAEFVDWFRSGGPQRPVDLNLPRDSGGAIHIATADVNIRTGPSTDYERLGTLAQGTRVAVFTEKANWGEVHLSDGTIGFVSMDYLRPE